MTFHVLWWKKPCGSWYIYIYIYICIDIYLIHMSCHQSTRLWHQQQQSFLYVVKKWQFAIWQYDGRMENNSHRENCMSCHSKCEVFSSIWNYLTCFSFQRQNNLLIYKPRQNTGNSECLRGCAINHAKQKKKLKCKLLMLHECKCLVSSHDNNTWEKTV